MRGLKYLTLVLVAFFLAGCGSFANLPGNDDEPPALLGDDRAEMITELAGEENEYYELRSAREEEGSIEIELVLTFNPLSFQEVMKITDPLADEVAALFEDQVPVAVSAIYAIESWGEERIYGESLFNPETGRTNYQHFGRDHSLRYGDP